MNTKKALGVLVVLIILGLIIWKVAMPAAPAVAPVVDSSSSMTPPATSFAGATLDANGDFVYKKETDYVAIDATYPSKTSLSAAADAKARLAIESSLKATIGSFDQDTSENMLTPDEEQRLKANHLKYSLSISYDEHASPGYVSYVFKIYEDTGGAHPNGFYSTLTFDMNGNMVELADLFKPGARYLDRLSTEAYKLVVAQLKEKSGTTKLDDTQLETVRMGTEPSPEALQFFYLDSGNLVLVFPPYQVAAYAAGSFEAKIPLASLKDILK